MMYTKRMTKNPPASRKRNYLKLTVISIALILAALAGYYVFRLYHPAVGFRHFEPSYALPGVTITDRRISITNGSMATEQNFGTKDWTYAITERKAGGPLGNGIQNYNPASIKPTCKTQTSPENMRYRLCHWIDYGRTNVYEITFIKLGTLVRAVIPTGLDKPLAIDNLSKFVDSFRQRSTLWLPVVSSKF